MLSLISRRSCSSSSLLSKRPLHAALAYVETLRPHSPPASSTSGPRSGGSDASLVEIRHLSTVFCGAVRGSHQGLCGVREFHVKPGPLGFRASLAVSAEYAVDECNSYYEEKRAAKSDEGLEVAKLGIANEIVDSLAKRGISKLFPIQKAVLEPAMQGRDMIGRAKTGTGKTLAFGIPIMDRIIQYNAKHGRGRNPLALVLAPTRELARQVEKEFYESAPSLDTICVYGGTPISRQMRQLDYGVDIVVGTPGRIIDLLKRGSLNLSEVQIVVLDEADQMLNVGFEEDVEVILDKLPKNRQSMMFSATMPSWIKNITRKYLNNPLTVDLVGDDDQKLAEGISLYSIAAEMYARASTIGPLITEHAKGGKCIVFVQTKRDADRLAYSMSRSIRCEALHGDISQNQRERTLSGFREGHFNVLVATDVAARGLDIPNVDLVIHYELPNSSEIFVHRSGRTGRAGKKGTVILIYTPDQSRTVKGIERDVGCRFNELPRIAVDPGSVNMFDSMGGGGRSGSYGGSRDRGFGDAGRFGGQGASRYGRTGGGYGGPGFGRSGGYGGSSSGQFSGRGGPSSGRIGSFGARGSGQSDLFGGSGSRAGNFGSPGSFGNTGSSPSRNSGFGDSGRSRFGSFGDEKINKRDAEWGSF